jgi:precorrin-2 C20-methyltransferase/precorrin-3B C17-methyltransferase
VLRHRPADTPVVVGRAVGRPGERLTITTLAGLDPAAVDMNTLLIIGSSTTTTVTQNARQAVFTPRHYPPETGSPRKRR